LEFIASIWENHFEAIFELQYFRRENSGLRYKLRLKNEERETNARNKQVVVSRG